MASASHRLELLYRAKAARAAPANMPRPAVAMAAAPLEVDVEARVELEEPLVVDGLLEPVVSVKAPVDVPVEVSVEVLVLVESVVAAVPAEVETLTMEVKVLAPLRLTTGKVRPAGIEAAGCWEVTTAG